MASAGYHFKWNDKEVIRLTEKGMQKNMSRACMTLERETKKLMKAGTGRRYKRGKKYHRASAPYDPPAVDTGRLRASISSNWNGSGLARGKVGKKAKPEDGIGKAPKERNKINGLVGSNVEYARYLELGTSKMEMRPCLRRALEGNARRLGLELCRGPIL